MVIIIQIWRILANLLKLESLMGKYLWNFSGKILRVSIDDMKNKKLEGGLNLPCLASMADSLLFSQLCRLLRSGDKKTLGHAFYWLGDLLVSLAPDIDLGQLGARATEAPEYFTLLRGRVGCRNDDQ